MNFGHNKFGSHHYISEDGERLVQRVKDGIASSKYRPVDYEHLRELTRLKKLTGQRQLTKVHKLKQISSEGRQQNLLKQHRSAWLRELLRLDHTSKRLQAELDMLTKDHIDGDLLSDVFRDFEFYEFGLDRNFQKFKEATVEPICNLREDLSFWSSENLRTSMSLQRDDIHLEDQHTVQDTLYSVKEQQNEVMRSLQEEQEALEADIDLVTREVCDPQSKPINVGLPQTGIPEAAFDLDCPDISLKASLLQEFILIDGRYTEKMKDLEAQHAVALRSETGGWSAEDHLWFTWINEQYPPGVNNRRSLVIDRLQRHLPHRSRQQIVKHEEWWNLYRFYFERRRDLARDWQRDRTELLNRISVLMEEARVAREKQLESHKSRDRQAEICQELLKKVEIWREQKLEAAQLTAQLTEQRHRECMEQLREEEERERKHRDQQRQEIRMYKQVQQENRRRVEEQARQRLEELQEHLHQQALHDQERVKFRQEEQRHKDAEKKKRAQDEKEREEEEKERVLEALREQVRPHVETDLLRLWQDTESWKQRHKEEPEPDIQRPLFDVKSFTSQKIMADPRMRLESRLREAGVHDNAYARQILAQTNPLQPTRRDTYSTVLK